jgi:hypothetical protein
MVFPINAMLVCNATVRHANPIASMAGAALRTARNINRRLEAM